MSQLAFGVDERLCNYGTPKLGESRPCSKPATHSARWSIPEAYTNGVPHPHGGESGAIDCCREHANYYATAWYPLNARSSIDPSSSWIVVLAA